LDLGLLSNNNFQIKTKNRSQTRRTLILWTSYLLLIIILTWPTTSHLTTHLPGDGGDDPAIAWNLWWVKHILLNEGQNPFQTDFIFYPVGINLAFYTLTVLNAVTALPLTLNLGVVMASNLHMLFTFMVGGYGTFLLVRYVLTTSLTAAAKSATGSRPPATCSATNGSVEWGDDLIWVSAAIAGVFYAFASSKLFYVALGQFNIASNHWVPLAILSTSLDRNDLCLFYFGFYRPILAILAFGKWCPAHSGWPLEVANSRYSNKSMEGRCHVSANCCSHGTHLRRWPQPHPG
jgi:hypothetical protein